MSSEGSAVLGSDVSNTVSTIYDEGQPIIPPVAPILTLSLDIQMMVHELVLFEGGRTTARRRNATSNQGTIIAGTSPPGQLSHAQFVHPANPRLAVATTCRELHLGAMRVWYARHRYIFNRSADLDNFLATIGPHGTNALRQVKLSLDPQEEIIGVRRITRLLLRPNGLHTLDFAPGCGRQSARWGQWVAIATLLVRVNSSLTVTLIGSRFVQEVRYRRRRIPVLAVNKREITVVRMDAWRRILVRNRDVHNL